MSKKKGKKKVEKKVEESIEEKVKKIVGRELSEEHMQYLIETYEREYNAALERGLKEDYAENLATHFTRREAEYLASRGR